MARLLIATDTFVTARRGRSEWVQAGEVAEHGSWPVEAHPHAFRPLEIKWRAPGSKLEDEPHDPLASPSVSPASIARKRSSSARGDGADDLKA